MDYEYKYLVGDIGEQVNELWEEYPDAMRAITDEAVRAYKTGFNRGFIKSGAVIMIGGSILAGVVPFIVKKIKNREKKTKKHDIIIDLR